MRTTFARRSARLSQLVLLPGLLCLAVAGCANLDAGEPGILIETAAHGQQLPGVACTAAIDDLHWDVVTPGIIAVGNARGELRVVCNQAGYRTSELIFRPAAGTPGLTSALSASGSDTLPLPAGGARYPRRLTLDMNPP